jgi:creatinine amidohydrolase
MRPWILAETNYAFTKENRYEAAVLPLGATEPHNLHLPYGTDILEGQIIGEKICEEAWRRGAKVVLLPAIPYGTETNMRGLPLAMNVYPSTLFRMVTDLVESLADSGVHKLLILNSHGGNEMKPLLRELAGKTPVHLFLSNWYKCFDDQYDNIFSAPEDHAGEMETSFGLAYFPHLVARDEEGKLQADEGRTAKTRFEAVNRGWVSITRPWSLLTTNTGSGNPHAAAAEKGEKMMQIVVDRLAGFLVELCAAKIDARFPF